MPALFNAVEVLVAVIVRETIFLYLANIEPPEKSGDIILLRLHHWHRGEFLFDFSKNTLGGHFLISIVLGGRLGEVSKENG